MREIHFRGKLIDSNEWIYGSYLHLDYHNSIDYVENHQIILKNGHPFEVIPETVGQYTGLNDCKGKKIYGGDILKFKSMSYLDSLSDGKLKEKIGVIEFDEENLCWKILGFTPTKKIDNFKFEKIGNIHEEPEFLKEQSND